MLYKMKTVLLVLLLLRDSLAVPTIEDNKLPTDQEVLGQPEEVASLGLPSDEESFNQLSVFFNPGKPPGQIGSGTYHFVSSTFPVDARGFHESVFDGIGDYFPSWPAPYKRDSDPPYSPTLAQRLGLRPHNRFRKRSDTWSEQQEFRKKNAGLYSSNSLQGSDYVTKSNPDSSPGWNKEQPAGNKTDRPSEEIRKVSKREVQSFGDEFEENGKSWLGSNKASNNLNSDKHYYESSKRSGARYVRGMEMGSSGFHGDAFSRDFGDFTTMKKRLKGSLGFHGDTFSDGFGDFGTMKRSQKQKELLSELKDYIRTLSENEEENSDTQGSSAPSLEYDFLSDTENEHSPVQKRKPEMTSMGFHGDTFSGGFGDFYPVKKRRPASGSMGFHGDTFSQGFGDFDPYKKRGPKGAMGFHGDTFSQGFGDFDTYKKKRPAMGSMGFHRDTFSQGFGDFDTYKKRRPEMDSMGFHGDTFTRGFGEFEPFKKRRAAAGSMGFHGDTFSQGFGDFDPYKKRRPEMDSMGFHGDTFSRGFGDFDPYKKRRANAGSMGFHGDTFSHGFGDFETLKKRRPEMDSMGFHGDTFTRGFGDFDVYKKRSVPTIFQGEMYNQESEEGKTEDKKCCSDSSIQRHQDAH